MRVLFPTCELPRGEVEPLLERAEPSFGFGAEVRASLSPDLAELLPGVGVPLVPSGAFR